MGGPPEPQLLAQPTHRHQPLLEQHPRLSVSGQDPAGHNSEEESPPTDQGGAGVGQELGHWEPTDLFKPGRPSTGTARGAFQCVETKEIGICKPTDVAREKIASDLARAVQVLVPETKLGRASGHAGIVAMSVVTGKTNDDVGLLRDRDPKLYNSDAVRQAIRAASGLLPFYAWLNVGDLKDDHLLITDDGTGNFSVAGIDFQSGLGWGSPTEAVQSPAGPTSLVNNVDTTVVQSTVDRIETCPPETIAAIVKSLPDEVLNATEKSRIADGLTARRSGVRQVMRQRGWVP